MWWPSSRAQWSWFFSTLALAAFSFSVYASDSAFFLAYLILFLLFYFPAAWIYYKVREAGAAEWAAKRAAGLR